jgi:hypothetical protein
MDAGLLAARGSLSAIARPETALRPWLASGVSGLLQQRAGRVILGARIGALASLTRDSFVFYTPLPESVHEVPAFVWTAELGFGVILGDSPP